jgi:hypothetical protein
MKEIQQKQNIAEKAQGARKRKYEEWAKKLSGILEGKMGTMEKIGIEMTNIRTILIKANRAKKDGNLELFSDLIHMAIEIAKKTKLSEQIFMGCSEGDIPNLLKENPERVMVLKVGKLMKIKIEEVKNNNRY